MILDEATSAVDSESENQIHEAMERLMVGRTVFLIAHRLASAVDADVIVVLDRGKIVEVGSHAELLKRAGVYSQLFNEQTRKLRLTPDPIARAPGLGDWASTVPGASCDGFCCSVAVSLRACSAFTASAAASPTTSGIATPGGPFETTSVRRRSASCAR